MYLMRQYLIKNSLLPFIAGFIYALGFPLKWTPSFFIFPLFGMALFLKSFSLTNDTIKEYSFKRELLCFFSYSFAIFFFGYYWIPYTLGEFGSIPFPLNYLLGSLFSVIVIPQYLFLLIAYFFWKKYSKEKSISIPNNSFSFSLVNCFLAFLITAFEYFTPQQFPAHIGHSWIQLAPYLGLAPIFGVPIFSFFSYWISLSLLKYFTIKKTDWACILFTILFLALNFFFPLQYNPEKDPTTKSNYIRLVQANIGNWMKLYSEKGDLNTRAKVDQRYYELSTKPSKKPLDLIIWPETSYPAVLSSKVVKKFPRLIPRIFKKVTKKTGSQIFFGGYDRKPKRSFGNFETEFNTGFFLDSNYNLLDYYHKQKLIPFGEGLPFGPFNKFLSKYLTMMSFFAKGDRFTLFKTRNDTYFVNAICYEVLFSSFIRENFNSLKKQPHFIVNLTNDSWYGDTSEPHHHLSLSKWRALEFNIPLVRMTNTGITSVTYPDGSESKRLPLFKAATLDLELLTPQRKATLFQKFGFLNLTLLFSIISLLLFCVGRVLYRRN